jgi:hypothetical protein
MWSWFNCYLSGRHDYGMWCEPGTIFLRCIHCGRRSPGWHLHGADAPSVSHDATASTPRASVAKPVAVAVAPTPAAILPFKRPALG